MNGSLLRRVLAELHGTALLAFFGPGAVVASLTMGKGSLDQAGLGVVALSFGLVVALGHLRAWCDLRRAQQPCRDCGAGGDGRFRWAEVPANVGPPWLVIGLAVVCEIFVIGPFTGGSVNPARTFGPYVANALSGGTTPWGELWIYVVGPVVGAGFASSQQSPGGASAEGRWSGM